MTANILGYTTEELFALAFMADHYSTVVCSPSDLDSAMRCFTQFIYASREPEQRYIIKAREAIEYYKSYSLYAMTGSLHGARKEIYQYIIGNPATGFDAFNLLPRVPYMYKKEIEQHRYKDQLGKYAESKHIGTEGARQKFELEVLAHRSISQHNSSTLWKCLHGGKDIVGFFHNGRRPITNLHDGGKIMISGYISEHVTNFSRKETILNRVRNAH